MLSIASTSKQTAKNITMWHPVWPHPLSNNSSGPSTDGNPRHFWGGDPSSGTASLRAVCWLKDRVKEPYTLKPKFLNPDSCVLDQFEGMSRSH